ncbi:hypothetical protein [Viridibacillus arvi]|uniref:hypothetical protein n=1 Tax=Viridibacillus arvi TaxID=263475 RepID=UPI003D2E3804
MPALDAHEQGVITLINGVRDTQILVKSFTYNCKPQSKIISRSIQGQQSLSLSNQYLTHLATQSAGFEKEVIIPFSKFCNHKFIVNVNADVNGQLDLENLKVKIRISCPSEITTHIRTFNETFYALLPFAEYLEKINVAVHNFRVRVVEGEFTISSEELLLVIQDPIRYAKLEMQWDSHFSKIYRRARSVFSFESTIDVFEGEMYADEVNYDIKQTFSKY